MLREKKMQLIDGGLGGTIERNANAQFARKRNSGFFERTDFVDGELGIGAFLNAHATTHQDRYVPEPFQLLLKLFVSLREDQHVHRTGNVFERALRVKSPFFDFSTRRLVTMPAVVRFSSLLVEDFMAHRSSTESAPKSSSFSRYFSSGCPVMKKPRISFSKARRVCSSQSGRSGSRSSCA